MSPLPLGSGAVDGALKCRKLDDLQTEDRLPDLDGDVSSRQTVGRIVEPEPFPVARDAAGQPEQRALRWMLGAELVRGGTPARALLGIAMLGDAIQLGNSRHLKKEQRHEMCGGAM